MKTRCTWLSLAFDVTIFVALASSWGRPSSSILKTISFLSISTVSFSLLWSPLLIVGTPPYLEEGVHFHQDGHNGHNSEDIMIKWCCNCPFCWSFWTLVSSFKEGPTIYYFRFQIFLFVYVFGFMRVLYSTIGTVGLYLFFATLFSPSTQLKTWVWQEND